jgi:hypothetical protein
MTLLLSWLFCRHIKRTTPRRDDAGEYCRCLDCGYRIPWSWGVESPTIRDPRKVQVESGIQRVEREQESDWLREMGVVKP